MNMQLAASDVIILSGAAACLVAVVLLEMLRVIIPDVYEWVADHNKIKREIKDAKANLDKTLARNAENGALRDRRNAERFRMKSQLSRLEMTLGAVERDRVEVWHELGQQVLGDSLFTARAANRRLADLTTKDFDSAPCIWRYSNQIRIWAGSERAARQMLATEFPADAGFAVTDIMAVAGGRSGAGRP